MVVLYDHGAVMDRDGPEGNFNAETVDECWPGPGTLFTLQRLSADSELLCTIVDGSTRLLPGGRMSLQGKVL